MFSRMPRIYAHRGMCLQAPENTLAAFRMAKEAGAGWIETDVDVTSDGTPIIIHDTDLDRTTNRSGSIYDLGADDLEGIDAGSWFSSDFEGEPLPTLTQLVDLMNEIHLSANIELKSHETGAALSRSLIWNTIGELMRLKRGAHVVVSSFNPLLLAEFKRAAPQWPVAWLTTRETFASDWRSMLELIDADYLHPEDASLTREKVRMVRAAGFGVNVWTVNSRARANELKNWGVTGIITDRADHLLN
ncbi:MAG: glycerophosphodiester phosphodiesterase family protein [Actinomycetaceae bacterium]|nr:glycerophosphodiester phosphodiesterase family protein [Actinomycetaceae bacterium]